MNIKCEPARIQTAFDTGRWKQPPKAKGWRVECRADGEHRIVEFVPMETKPGRWRFTSAKTFGADNGFPMQIHFKPMSRDGYSLEEAKALATEFCETRAFACVQAAAE